MLKLTEKLRKSPNLGLIIIWQNQSRWIVITDVTDIFVVTDVTDIFVVNDVTDVTDIIDVTDKIDISEEKVWK